MKKDLYTVNIIAIVSIISILLVFTKVSEQEQEVEVQKNVSDQLVTDIAKQEKDKLLESIEKIGLAALEKNKTEKQFDFSRPHFATRFDEMVKKNLERRLKMYSHGEKFDVKLIATNTPYWSALMKILQNDFEKYEASSVASDLIEILKEIENKIAQYVLDNDFDGGPSYKIRYFITKCKVHCCRYPGDDVKFDFMEPKTRIPRTTKE